jgi:O-6-methylguanine DNA methyltransferase
MSSESVIYRELETPVGAMLAGATAEGLVLLEFADRGGFERIATRVHKRYKTDLVAGDLSILDDCARQLEEYFAGRRREFDLELALKGTPWQEQVWGELLRIPYGETRSYGELAAALGKPGASRAVGRANGDNYIAIVVPCHRVIESSGALRGYGGGLWRKRRLLDLENQNDDKRSKQYIMFS